MRLIDADAFLKRNEVYADCEFIHPMYQNTLREIVDDEPTIDAVQVRHGEWIEISDDPLHGLKKCSNCGELSCCLANYCPDCGAKMDGERREG